MPLLNEHYVLLQRYLLYTAVTRARRLVVVIGSKQALRMAINRAEGTQRLTLLRSELG